MIITRASHVKKLTASLFTILLWNAGKTAPEVVAWARSTIEVPSNSNNKLVKPEFQHYVSVDHISFYICVKITSIPLKNGFVLVI